MTTGRCIYYVLSILIGSRICHCNVAKDILFLLDTSESIGEFVFNGQMIPIVQNFLQNPDLVFDDQNTQVGLLASSNGQHLDVPLKNYQTKEELIKSLKDIPFNGGNTDLHMALNYTQHNLLTPDKGDRSNADNVLVVLTDGGVQHPLETLSSVERMKAQGLSVYVVVAGCRFNWFIIENMASSGGHVITDLHHFSPAFTANHLWTEICKCQHTTPRVTTPSPTVPVTPSPSSRPRTSHPHHVFYTGTAPHPSQLPCIDNDDDCHLISKDNCITYRSWAMGSCRKTCGLCPQTTSPTTVTPRYTITASCFDADVLVCKQFPATQLCADLTWAFGSCRKTCGLCEKSTTVNPLQFVTLQKLMAVTIPKNTTPKPTAATPKPTTTAPKPTTTTPKPTTTTPKPTTTTTKPTTTTPKPTTTTPKPTTTTLKPTTTTPKPTTTTPKPTTTTPKPTTTTPKPTTTTPKLTTTTPQPTTTTPKPTTTTPKPTTTTPKPTTTTPNPTTTTQKPTTTTPQPTTTTPKPTTTTPKPTTTTPKPTTTTPKPTTTTPKPTTTTPKPTTTTPKPTTQRHLFLTIRSIRGKMVDSLL